MRSPRARPITTSRTGNASPPELRPAPTLVARFDHRAQQARRVLTDDSLEQLEPLAVHPFPVERRERRALDDLEYGELAVQRHRADLHFIVRGRQADEATHDAGHHAA